MINCDDNYPFLYFFKFRLKSAVKLFICFCLNCFDQTLGVFSVCPIPRVCYERCPINPTAATFLLSAMWHGVYPGYYLTFLTGIAMTMAARAVSTHTVSLDTAPILGAFLVELNTIDKIKISRVVY